MLNFIVALKGGKKRSMRSLSHASDILSHDASAINIPLNMFASRPYIINKHYSLSIKVLIVVVYSSVLWIRRYLYSQDIYIAINIKSPWIPEYIMIYF